MVSQTMKKIFLTLILLMGGHAICNDDVVIPMGENERRNGCHHCDFSPGGADDKIHWSRLLFLSSITPDSIVNPFNDEQQRLFQAESNRRTQHLYYVYGGIAFGIFVNALGYIAFIGIADDHLANILVPAILPTATILSVLFTIYGASYEIIGGIYDGLPLTCHEDVLEELNFLAQFLVRKGFSKNESDMENVKKVIDNMDLEAIKAAYARQGNAQINEVSVLVRSLHEALVYLKDDKIIDESAIVGEEIQLCLLKDELAELKKEMAAIKRLVKVPARPDDEA
jgi:hypothetical protein